MRRCRQQSSTTSLLDSGCEASRQVCAEGPDTLVFTLLHQNILLRENRCTRADLQLTCLPCRCSHAKQLVGLLALQIAHRMQQIDAFQADVILRVTCTSLSIICMRSAPEAAQGRVEAACTCCMGIRAS